ncbi:MAG: hypothetical protein H6633_22095 [Anaerolineales bacterium]|nr:hypothetical protein [Anaerolineales bacterium]
MNKTTHTVDKTEDRTNVTFSGFSNDIRSPIVAAVGSNVYVAWANDGSVSETHALIGMRSSDEGATWSSSGSNDTFTDIPGDSNTFNTALAPDAKYSEDGTAVPIAELGLQPNLAVRGTDFAIVWDQRANQECSSELGGLSLSRIYAAWPSSNWNTNGPLASSGGSSTDYFDIDPSIAFNGTTPHIVFLRADVSSTVSKCLGGGGSIPYSVYYQGPFTKFSGYTTYVPVVTK